MTKFATQIRQARHDRGETLAQVAHEVGITQGTYWRYEAGKQLPRLGIALRIAQYLGVSLDDLQGQVGGDSAH